jgi:hypothetical protein
MRSTSNALAGAPECEHLDAHSRFLLTARALYAENVRWSAPTRDLACEGRENVIRRLLREAGGMHAPEISALRRSHNDRQLIDEYVILFTYSGEGIENAPIAAGDLVELKRLRILDLEEGKVVNEVCIETWSVLLREPLSGDAAHDQRARDASRVE